MSPKHAKPQYDLALIRKWLDDYATLNLRGQPRDPEGWIMLKLSCSRAEARKLIDAVHAEGR